MRLRTIILIFVACLLILPALLLPIAKWVDPPGPTGMDQGGAGGIVIGGYRLTWKKIFRRIFVSRLFSVVPTSPYPVFNLQSWFEGRFQKAYQDWFEEKLVLREAFVRLNNELFYRVFKKSYMYNQGVIVGKNNEIFELVYIKEYCGIAPLTAPSEQRLDDFVKRVATARSVLKSLGKELIVVLAPQKAEMLPQFIPDRYCRAPGPQRLADRLPHLLENARLPIVEGRAELRRVQGPDSPAPFPLGGTHWNDWGAYWSARAVIERMRASGIAVDTPQLEGFTIDRKPFGFDADLASLLHLLIPNLNYEVPRAHFVVAKRSAMPAGSLLIIGDSFGFRVSELLDQSNIFKYIRYYFYYTKGRYTYPGVGLKDVSRADAQWVQDLQSADAVVLIGTPVTILGEVNFNFMDDVITQFGPAKVH